MVKAYRTKSLPAPVREKVGAALACVQYTRGLDESEISWQSFQFARFNADKALALIQKDLKGYAVDDGEYPYMVTTPSGEEFSCSPNYFD